MVNGALFGCFQNEFMLDTVVIDPFKGPVFSPEYWVDWFRLPWRVFCVGEQVLCHTTTNRLPLRHRKSNNRILFDFLLKRPRKGFLWPPRTFWIVRKRIAGWLSSRQWNRGEEHFLWDARFSVHGATANFGRSFTEIATLWWYTFHRDNFRDFSRIGWQVQEHWRPDH